MCLPDRPSLTHVLVIPMLHVHSRPFDGSRWSPRAALPHAQPDVQLAEALQTQDGVACTVVDAEASESQRCAAAAPPLRGRRCGRSGGRKKTREHFPLATLHEDRLNTRHGPATVVALVVRSKACLYGMLASTADRRCLHLPPAARASAVPDLKTNCCSDFVL